MRFTRIAAFTAFIVPALAGLAAAQQPAARPDPLVREGVTEKISDHVYVIPDNSVPMVPNVGIIVGRRGTLVVDTGLGARNGQAIVRELSKVSTTPEQYLASTHVHPEHDLGAGGFPATTKMIRSRAQVQEIAEGGLQMAQRFSAMSPINAELLKGAEFRKADITFETDHVLDLGGVRVRIMAMGANHTAGDTAFFVEPDGVLFSGDVVMTALPAFAAQTSSVRRWMQSLDRFKSLEPRRIVPSHGPMGDASMIAAYQAFLQTVVARTGALKKEGRTVDEAVQVVGEELAGKYPDRNRLAGAVRAAYREAP